MHISAGCKQADACREKEAKRAGKGHCGQLFFDYFTLEHKDTNQLESKNISTQNIYL
jgi:hypothetical protein